MILYLTSKFISNSNFENVFQKSCLQNFGILPQSWYTCMLLTWPLLQTQALCERDKALLQSWVTDAGVRGHWTHPCWPSYPSGANPYDKKQHLACLHNSDIFNWIKTYTSYIVVTFYFYTNKPCIHFISIMISCSFWKIWDSYKCAYLCSNELTSMLWNSMNPADDMEQLWSPDFMLYNCWKRVMKLLGYLTRWPLFPPYLFLKKGKKENISSGDGLVLIYHQWGPVTFTWRQYHKICFAMDH